MATMRLFAAIIFICAAGCRPGVHSAPSAGPAFRVIEFPSRRGDFAYRRSLVAYSSTDAGLVVPSPGVDFTKEALVQVCRSEGSGSIGGAFLPLDLQGATLRCRLTRRGHTVGIGTGDMAYYCFAMAVDKSRVRKVRIEVDGDKSILLKVKR